MDADHTEPSEHFPNDLKQQQKKHGWRAYGGNKFKAQSTLVEFNKSRMGKIKMLQGFSNECAGKIRRKADWNQIDLIELSKSMSKRAIGKMLGVSDVAIAKRLRTLVLNK